MSEDHPSSESLQEATARLEYLEQLMRDQVSRIYRIEQHLGIEKQATPPEPLMVQPARREPVIAPQPAPVAPEPLPPVLPTIAEPLAEGALYEEWLHEKPLPGQSKLSYPHWLKLRQQAMEAAPQSEAVEPLPEVTVPPSSVTIPAPPVVELKQTEDWVAPYRPVKIPPSITVTEPVAQPAGRSSIEWEELIGGNWFNRIGILAIIIGVGLFLKLAFDRQWIGPTGRVMIGLAIGVGFVVGGEIIRQRGYRNYAHGLLGGGIAILYLSVFAAFARYQIIGQVPAFALMSMVTALAVLQAARYDAYVIAVMGLLGGFLTPIMLSTGRDNETGLFSYIALLDLGVLGVAYFKQWRSLNYLAFWATVLMAVGWAFEHYQREKLWTTIFFFTVFFLIFATLAIFHNVVNRKPTTRLDLSLIFSNATIYFSASYALLNEQYRPYLGLFAVLMSAFYVGFGYFARSRVKEDRYLIYSFLGLATLFLTLAVPIQFDQQWVTMGWAVEGAVLTWIGLKAESRATRYSGLLMFAIAVWHWFQVDVHDFAYYSWQAVTSFTPVLNKRGASVIVMIAAFAIAAHFYRTLGEQIEESERTRFAEICLLAANMLAVIWLSIDANDYFRQVKAGVPSGPGISTDSELLERIETTRQLALTALWTVYGATTLIAGITRRIRLVRYFSHALLGLAIVKVLAVDATWYSISWHTLIFNRTFAAFVLTIAALLCGTWFYRRAKEIDEHERRALLIALPVIANLLMIIALSLEASGYFNVKIWQAIGEERLVLDNTKQFSLTAIWAIYGTIALFAGFRQKAKLLRYGALALIALATIKVLVVDASFHNAPWHSLIFNYTFAAFALVIGALACGLWLYKRETGIEDAERGTAIPVLLAAANLLAVIGLSLEAIGYFSAKISRSQGEEWRQLDNTKHFTLSILWSFYAAVVLIIGIRRKYPLLRLGALALLALAVAKVLVIDAFYYNAPWHVLIFNQTFGAFIPLIAALALGAWFYARADEREVAERTLALTAIMIAANLLAIIALSLEANGYYSSAISRIGNDNEELRNLVLAKQLSLSVIWAVYGGAMLVVGFWRKNRLLRLMALVLLVLAIVKVFLWDLRSLDNVYRIIAFIVLGVILLVVSFLYQQLERRAAETEE